MSLARNVKAESEGFTSTTWATRMCQPHGSPHCREPHLLKVVFFLEKSSIQRHAVNPFPLYSSAQESTRRNQAARSWSSILKKYFLAAAGTSFSASWPRCKDGAARRAQQWQFWQGKLKVETSERLSWPATAGQLQRGSSRRERCSTAQSQKKNRRSGPGSVAFHPILERMVMNFVKTNQV
jgi:hypothetical protein